ncbi:7TM-DISM domain-containing protein [Echinicola jeungdonensis]|uniref:7TM-DISM domain-containing protein n=1 Tax=Echinicola jeungdonensis TaxID=709343 RepID=A0ABV5J9K0_9BACT|nr:7TM-DISM domain-containing protein [Echinicola jeungdonensis]MDN3670412.1 7TM-DISM domain-containing protein [Echinicola jeungdonensis]
MEYYVDPTSELSIEDISDSTFQQNFLQVTDNHVVYGALNENLWLKMIVENQQDVYDHSWYFESWGFDLDEITFYFPNPEGNFISNTAGYDFPFSKRNIHHKNFNYFLDLRPGEKKTYYFKINRSYPLAFNFHLRSNERFISHSLNEYLLLGIYYGVLFIIFIFNVYLTFKLKDSLYLYFSGFIFACIWFSFGRDGLGFQFLWPNLPSLNKITDESITQLLVILATLLFSNKFVQKYNSSPRLFKLTLLAIAMKLVVFANQELGYTLNAIPYITVTLIILLIPFLVGLYKLIKTKIYSWSYILAYTCLFLVIIHSYTKTITLFNDPIINWYIVHPVIFIQVVLFSLSIFNQIKFLQDQFQKVSQERTEALKEKNKLTDEMNNQLQIKVKERTEQIEKMATDLASKNVELQTTNIKLRELNSQVEQINEFLRENNKELKMSVDETTKNLALMKGLDFEDFKKVFPDKDSCLKFLAELKWKNKYTCKKCGYNKFAEGANHGRRCKNCNYYESPTVDTLFHKLKFPIEKAFYILYLSNRKDVDLTLNELSEILDLRRETCWAFKNKINQAMEKTDHNKELSGWENLALVHPE